MSQKKLLALATAFDEAPKQVKDEANGLKDAYLRIEKAQQQIRLWDREQNQARADLQRQERRFAVALKQWDPADVKGSELVEAPVEEKPEVTP